MATESFEKMADSLFESNWGDLPVDLQKFYILMIGNAQKPMFYHGFKVAVLNLETFMKVSALHGFYKIVMERTFHF